MKSEEEYMRELYANVGFFILTYERVITILKLIIFKNFITEHDDSDELPSYKVIKAFAKAIRTHYIVSMEKHADDFEMLVKKLIEANRLRNKYLHAQIHLSMWIKEEGKSGIAFLLVINKLYLNGDLFTEKFKIGRDEMEAHINGMKALHEELTQINFVTRGIVSLNYMNTTVDIFEKFNFDRLRDIDFKIYYTV
jgi:hypothetical protein